LPNQSVGAFRAGTRHQAPAFLAMAIDKQQIEEAFTKHHTRTACLILEQMTLVLDLLDIQPADLLEALIEEGKRRHITGPPSRQGVREALIEYAAGIQKDARERERRLYHGITGK
jgi:hypothetical protein